MERVLIVSSSANGREFLRELLRGQEYGQVVFADNGGEARRSMAEDGFSLVVINAPLRDESGEQLALWTAQSTDAGVGKKSPVRRHGAGGCGCNSYDGKAG